MSWDFCLTLMGFYPTSPWFFPGSLFEPFLHVFHCFQQGTCSACSRPTTSQRDDWGGRLKKSTGFEIFYFFFWGGGAGFQGCRFGLESSQTLVSPIFGSSLVPSVADSFRKCIGDKSATLVFLEGLPLR